MTEAVSPTRPLNWLPLAFVLTLPVLLSGVGVWEAWRGATTRAEYQDAVAGLSGRLESLQALGQQDLGATVQFRQDRSPTPVGVAVARL